MPRQRYSSQKKEQEKVMSRDLIKIDISNMPDSEFKAIIIRILTGLEKKHRIHQEYPYYRDKRPKNQSG